MHRWGWEWKVRVVAEATRGKGGACSFPGPCCSFPPSDQSWRGQTRTWVWHSDGSWFQDKQHSFTTGTEKKGKSTHRRSSKPCSFMPLFTVGARTPPGTVPGARGAVVSRAKSLPSRDARSPGKQVSKEAITFHYDEGLRRAPGPRLSGCQKARICNLVGMVLLTTCVAPGRSLSHLVPEFLHLQTGRILYPFLKVNVRTNKITHVELTSGAGTVGMFTK